MSSSKLVLADDDVYYVYLTPSRINANILIKYRLLKSEYSIKEKN